MTEAFPAQREQDRGMAGPRFLGTDMTDPEVMPYFSWDAGALFGNGCFAAGERKGCLPHSLLSPFQKQVLEAFFAHENRFFLSGGGALAGFHLGHRRTEDLDLSTISDSLDDGDRALAVAAADLKATVHQTQTTADFRRRIIRRGEEAVVVDLVRDRAAQGPDAKVNFGAVRVDPPEEILANKLCFVLAAPVR